MKEKKKKKTELMKGISDLISCRIQFHIMVRKCNDGLNLYLNKRVIMLRSVVYSGRTRF